MKACGAVPYRWRAKRATVLGGERSTVLYSARPASEGRASLQLLHDDRDDLPRDARRRSYRPAAVPRDFDGMNPQTGLLQGSDGHLYGAASSGGFYGYGTIFRLDTYLCTNTIEASYTPEFQSLNLRFGFQSAGAGTWSTWALTAAGIQPLWSVPIGPVSLPNGLSSSFTVAPDRPGAVHHAAGCFGIRIVRRRVVRGHRHARGAGCSQVTAVGGAMRPAAGSRRSRSWR